MIEAETQKYFNFFIFRICKSFSGAFWPCHFFSFDLVSALGSEFFMLSIYSTLFIASNFIMTKMLLHLN